MNKWTRANYLPGLPLGVDGRRVTAGPEHISLSKEAAKEGMVLLKNDDAILPVSRDAKIAVIGEFARTPRYQGGGSSHITPTKMTGFLDALAERGVPVDFAYV